MKQFKCPHCGEIKEVNLWGRINHPHLFGVWLYMKCPKCEKYLWMRRVPKYKYTIVYVDFNNTYQSFIVWADSFRELSRKVKRTILKKDVLYISSIVTDK